MKRLVLLASCLSLLSSSAIRAYDDMSSSVDQDRTQHSCDIGNAPVAELEREYQTVLASFLQRRRLDAAEFVRLAERYDGSAVVHLLAGNVLSVATNTDEHYAKAIRQYDRTIALDPACAAAYVNRGVVRYLTAFPDSLAEALSFATTDSVPARLQEASERALQDFDAALKLVPALFSAHYNRGVLLKDIHREDDALAAFDAALRVGLTTRHIADPTVRDEAILEHVATGNPLCMMSAFRSYAVDTFLSSTVRKKRAVRLEDLVFFSNQNDPAAFAYYGKGAALSSSRKKEYKRAIEAFTKAIELNPNVPAIYQLRSVSFVAVGEVDPVFRTRG